MAFRCQSSLQQRNGGVCGKSTSGIMSIIAFCFNPALFCFNPAFNNDTGIVVCGKTTRSVISIMAFPFQSSLQHRHRKSWCVCVCGKTTRSIISIMAFPFQSSLQQTPESRCARQDDTQHHQHHGLSVSNLSSTLMQHHKHYGMCVSKRLPLAASGRLTETEPETTNHGMHRTRPAYFGRYNQASQNRCRSGSAQVLRGSRGSQIRAKIML